MTSGFNYSKWDNIELSDDESDLHPNIDKDSWFRMKHRTRLEREEREDRDIQAWNQKTAHDNARLNIINARIKAVEEGGAGAGEDAEFEDIEALKVEKMELESQIAERNKKIHEIQERRKWNIDNICKVKEEKTVVNSFAAKPLKADVSLVDANRIEPDDESSAVPSTTREATKIDTTSGASSEVPKSAPAAKPAAKAAAVSTPAPVGPTLAPAEPIKRERLAVISYNDYVIKHEALLEEYSEIADLEETKNFLFKHCDVLLHEHAQSYMLLSCLEDEMNGKKKRMKLVCRQSQILSHIHDLGTSMKRDPRDVILPFFKRIEEKEHFAGFTSAVEDFIQRIQKRAVEKRKEMDLERAREIREQHIAAGEKGPLGPGGLDPFEVLERLPVELRDAFESQDLEQLQAVLAHMKPADAKYWMKQCVDSGLWVPSDKSIFENEGELDADSGDEGEGGGKEQPRVEELDG